MRCALCQTDLPERANFCVTCGAAQGGGAPDARSAERRQVSVMMVDLVGSTALTADHDPEEMRDALSIYHRRMAEQIRRFGGFIARTIGDGALVYFGYPQAHENDAERAIRAALACVAALSSLTLLESHRPQVRIGIATGMVVVGDTVGDGRHPEYDIVGDAPNLASRLQALAPPNGIVIAEATRRLVGDLFAVDDLGVVGVKGFAVPARAFHVLHDLWRDGRFEALHGTGVTSFVGRAAECAQLLACWRQAERGDGQVALLSGEAGIGKSRLVAELRHGLAGSAMVPILYFCSQFHQDSALHPVGQQIARAAGFARDDPAELRLGKLTGLLARGDDDASAVALLADLLALPVPDTFPALSVNPETRRQAVLQALLAQLRGLAARHPVLIVVEDAHWIDPTTRQLLDRVVERLVTLPVLLIVTFRDGFAPIWAGQAHVTRVALTHLAPGYVAELIGHLTHGKPLPQTLRDQIIERTDGVPLFVEEMTKAVLETAPLREGADRYVLTGPLPQFTIPATLQDTLVARLDRLFSVKAVMQVASVIGRDFTFDLLALLSDTPEADLRSALEQLRAAELVFVRGHGADAVYTFKHALVLDAAYQTMLRGPRRALHLRAARVIQETQPQIVHAQPEVVAHHYAGAGDEEQAAVWFLAAGGLASKRYAQAEARGQYRKALDALALAPDTVHNRRREIDATLKYTEVSLPAGRPAEDLERLRAAEAMARDILRSPDSDATDAARLAWVDLWLGRVLLYLNRLPEAMPHYRRVLTVAEASGDEELLGVASGMIGRALAVQGHFSEAAGFLARALPLLERRRLFAEHVFCLGFIGLTNAAFGDYAGGLAAGERAHQAAVDLNFPSGIAFSQILLWGVHLQGGEPARMLESARYILKISERTGDLMYVYLGYGMLGWAEALAGDPVAGLAHFERSREVFGKLGGRAVLADWFAALYAELLLRVGRVDDALHAAQAAVAEAQAAEGIFAEALARRAWAATLMALDDSDWPGAEAQLQASVRGFAQGGAHVEVARTHLVWALIDRRRGADASAAEHLAMAASRFDAAGLARELERADRAYAGDRS